MGEPHGTNPRGPTLRTLDMEYTTMTLVDEYRAGACNIGPAEIARRRWTGHAGSAVTLAAAAVLIGADAAAWLRLGLFVPASVAAAGYLQAATRFCADYGWRGVFNFGQAGHGNASRVADRQARAADRRKALGIMGASAAMGLAVTLLALVL